VSVKVGKDKNGTLMPLLERNMQPGKEAMQAAEANAKKVADDAAGNPKIAREMAKLSDAVKEAQAAFRDAHPKGTPGTRAEQATAARAIREMDTQAARLASAIAKDPTRSEGAKARSIREFRETMRQTFLAMRAVGFPISSQTWKPPKLSSSGGRANREKLT
jgi:hypothetical protein